MSRSMLLDWLRFTVSEPHQNALFISHFGLMVEGCTAQGFYNTALRLHCTHGQCGRIDWHTDHPAQRVCYTFTGKDLDAWRAMDKVESLLAWAVAQKAHFTRADIAIDVKGDDRANVRSLIGHMGEGKAKTSTRTWSSIEGHGPRAGYTLYVGARQSDKFLRVYDKAAEQGVMGDWIRIEMECKGDYAKRMVPMILHNGLDFGRGEIVRFVDFPEVTWWRDATAGGEYDKVEVDRTPGDRRKWQNEVLLGMVADALDENEEFRAAVLRIVARWIV